MRCADALGTDEATRVSARSAAAWQVTGTAVLSSGVLMLWNTPMAALVDTSGDVSKSETKRAVASIASLGYLSDACVSQQ